MSVFMTMFIVGIELQVKLTKQVNFMLRVAEIVGVSNILIHLIFQEFCPILT